MTQIITVHGGLTAAPEMRFSQSGTPIASGTVASTERYQDRKTGEWRDGKKLFQRWTAFGPLAENINASNLSKGERVAVTGKLHTREFQDKDGNQRSVNELEVSDFMVSIKHATAQVTRAQQQGQGGGFGAGAGQQSQQGWNTPQNGGSEPPQFGGNFDDDQPF